MRNRTCDRMLPGTHTELVSLLGFNCSWPQGIVSLVLLVLGSLFFLNHQHDNIHSPQDWGCFPEYLPHSAERSLTSRSCKDPFHNQRSGYHNITAAMLLFGCIEVCEINIGIATSLEWATCDRHGSVGGWLPAMPTAVSVRKAKWILKRRTGSM